MKCYYIIIIIIILYINNILLFFLLLYWGFFLSFLVLVCRALVTMYPLSNVQINSILSSHFHTKQYYHGCFNRDTLPHAVAKYPSFYICNTALTKEKGEHWLLVGFTDRHAKGELFDSLGGKMGTHHENIYNFLKRNSNGEIEMNSKAYQSEKSQVCGHFCLYFSDLRCQGMDYSTCLQTFTEDLSANELRVGQFVMQHMRV